VFWLFIALVAIFVIYRLSRRKKLQITEELEDPVSYARPYEPTPSVRRVEDNSYHPRHSVFTRSEAAFFDELKRQTPEGYHVFPKMRIADILNTPHGSGYYKRVYKIIPKHVDFVVCDQYFKPLVAVEVNGSSHRRAKTQESDALKKEIFEVAGMPLIAVPVGSSFASAVQEVISYF